jgi:hypothetical protein
MASCQIRDGNKAAAFAILVACCQKFASVRRVLTEPTGRAGLNRRWIFFFLFSLPLALSFDLTI